MSKRGDRNEMHSPGFSEFWITSSRCPRLVVSLGGVHLSRTAALSSRRRAERVSENGIQGPPGWSQGSRRQIWWGLGTREVILITVSKSLKNQEISELKYSWVARFNPSKFRRPPVIGKQVLPSNRPRWIKHPEGTADTKPILHSPSSDFTSLGFPPLFPLSLWEIPELEVNVQRKPALARLLIT